MHRITLALLASFLPLTLYGANPQTLRVDYYHSGNSEAEIFSLDRVVLEPLTFPGNLKQGRIATQMNLTGWIYMLNDDRIVPPCGRSRLAKAKEFLAA